MGTIHAVLECGREIHHGGCTCAKDAEIARLKAEVEQLRRWGRERNDELCAIIDTERADLAALKAEVERLTIDAAQARGRALDHAAAATSARGARQHEIDDLFNENQALRADLARHQRALAAGPAALRIDARDGEPWGPYKQLTIEEAVSTVERAQAAALLDGGKKGGG